jgi:pilus assembly protein CpaF
MLLGPSVSGVGCSSVGAVPWAGGALQDGQGPGFHQHCAADDARVYCSVFGTRSAHMGRHFMETNGSDPAGLVIGGILTRRALEFLEACVYSRLNVAVCGPEGCGKRAVLHALVSCMDSDGQILAVQNPDERWLEHKSVTPLRARLGPEGGAPGISRRYLLSLVPKMHPTGLIVDQVEGEEVVALLQLLLNMDGIIFSVTAESAVDALRKLEELARLHGTDARPSVIRRILSTDLQLVVELSKLPSGRATAVRFAEVRETDQGHYSLCDIFVSADEEVQADGAADTQCALRPTGALPVFLSRMTALGICLTDNFFT